MPVFIDVEYLQGWRLFVVLSDGTTGALDRACKSNCVTAHE